MRNDRGKVKSDDPVISKQWVFGGAVTVEGRTFIVPDDAELDGLIAEDTEDITGIIEGIIEVIPESVGQGTGKCVGGTEIFNGDILRSFHFKDKHGKKHYLYHQVRWSPTYLSWMVCAKGEQDKPEDNRQGSPPLWVYLKNSLEVEVIGNTTDNPKLLEQRQ